MGMGSKLFNAMSGMGMVPQGPQQQGPNNVQNIAQTYAAFRQNPQQFGINGNDPSVILQNMINNGQTNQQQVQQITNMVQAARMGGRQNGR